MIQLSFNGTDVRVISALDRMGPAVLASLARRIDVIDLHLQQHIVTQKLQGQVLHHRTGKLASSVRIVPVHNIGSRLSGGVEAGGGPAWYGRLHEFGGAGAYTIVPVQRKALHFMVGGADVFARRVRHPAAAERSFMRSSFEENREWIVAQMREAMAQGLGAP